jgi:anti-sigma regulatory factor (Ser/Thr protein kinase)
MSHEIRTPMNAVLGYAQLLRRDPGLTPEQVEKIDVILASGDHLLVLINNVLDMSKIEAERITLVDSPFDLRELLDGLLQMFAGLARAKGMELELEVLPSLPRALRGDAGRVRQVLINLLSNAVKFTERGSIYVRAEASEVSDTRDRVIISVRDTGRGIEPRDQARVFDAFEQAEAGMRAGGTGLGLAISRNLARLMAGDLTVSSELGRGTTFTFAFEAERCTTSEFPARDAAERPQPRAASTSAHRPARIGAEDARRSLPPLLANVPKTLTERMRTAAVQARAAQIEALTLELAEHSEEAAANVRALTREFRYEELISLLERPAQGA